MGRREGETEMGKSEAEKTMEMRDGDWDRGRGLTRSRVETRHLPASAYGGALAHHTTIRLPIPPSTPQIHVPDPDDDTAAYPPDPASQETSVVFG